MDASQLPKGQSAEVTPGRKRNEPGIYHHPGADKTVITVADPNDGAIQADALVRMGYRRTGDVPSKTELTKMRAAQLAKDLAKGPTEADGPTGFNGTLTPSVNDLKDQLAAEQSARQQAEEALKALAPKKK